jgi:hypothetical protein
MIEPGSYTLLTLEGGDQVSRTGVEVIEVQLPLIKVRHQAREWILNVGASTFISAEPETGVYPRIVIGRSRNEAPVAEAA